MIREIRDVVSLSIMQYGQWKIKNYRMRLIRVKCHSLLFDHKFEIFLTKIAPKSEASVMN